MMIRSSRLDRCLSRESCPPVYGPIAHPVFGASLCLNLGPASRKECTWACRFCQRLEGESGGGRSSAKAMLDGLRKALSGCEGVRAVALAGNGEPTLHSEFAEIVESLRALRDESRADWRILCVTNGTRLGDPRVSAACDRIDEVWAKLDCADEETFQRLTLGGRGRDSIRESVARLAKLREPRLLTFLWRSEELGGQNWQAANLRELVRAYEVIRPKAIHVSTVDAGTVLPPYSPVGWDDLQAFVLRVEETGLAAEVV